MQEAVRLFTRRGYDGVGVQEICDSSGITKPTLYHYFGSKRGLIEAIIREQGAPLVEALARAAQYERDIVRSVTRVAECLFDFAEEHPELYRMFLAMWFSPPDSEYAPAVGELFRRQHAILEKLFLDAVPEHGNMRGRHEQYAISLRGTVDTYVGLRLQGATGSRGGRESLHRILHQFLHGVFS